MLRIMEKFSAPGFGRRSFIGGVFAAAGGIALSQETKTPEPPKLARNPLVYQFKIGDIEAWSISDGHSLMGKGNPLGMMWPEEDRPVMKTWMEEHNERMEGIPLYINILVIRRGKEVILFDAGFRPGKNPNWGWLGDGLAQIGISPDQVTAGFLSHAHGDHLEGFVRDGKPAFPNAAFHYLPDEYAFWHGADPDFSKSRRNKQQLPGMVKSVRADFEALKSVSQPVKPGSELFGGMVTIEAAPGHTAGHAVFRIKSGNESLLHIMDLAHHHGLNLHNPDWTIEFDHDPVQSVETRKKIFARAAAERTRCYGFHLPWPGLGQIVPVGNGYLWHPERWSWGS
jgi:glyoxylase-like metal-dependent hydrolase (beta-lactamase superfamily II)